MTDSTRPIKFTLSLDASSKNEEYAHSVLSDWARHIQELKDLNVDEQRLTEAFNINKVVYLAGMYVYLTSPELASSLGGLLGRNSVSAEKLKETLVSLDLVEEQVVTDAPQVDINTLLESMSEQTDSVSKLAERLDSFTSDIGKAFIGMLQTQGSNPRVMETQAFAGGSRKLAKGESIAELHTQANGPTPNQQVNTPTNTVKAQDGITQTTEPLTGGEIKDPELMKRIRASKQMSEKLL